MDGQSKIKQYAPSFFSKFGALLNFQGKKLISGSEEFKWQTNFGF